MKSVTTPRGALRPAPPDAQIKCKGCVSMSRWLVLGDAAMCGTCVLYASELIFSSDDLAFLISEVEATMGRALTRNEQGRLHGQDADRIVFAICVVSNGAPKLR